MRLVSTGEDQPTSRRLGSQTQGKQIKIWSTRDLGNLDIKVQATGDNCLRIMGITDNLCQKVTSNFNPSKNPQNYNVEFGNTKAYNKAGTTVVTVEFCIKNTDKCIKKAAKIEIIADPLTKATIITPTDEVIAGGEIPITVD